jgi:hypothetical protein
MRSWSLPQDVQRRLLADHWSFSGLKCIHCELSKVRMVQIKRIDGNTGSLHG